MSAAGPTARLCEYCKEPLIRRADESNGNWQKRKSCGEVCGDRLRAAGGRASAGPAPMFPGVTAEDTADFSGHNISPGDGGPFLIARPATHVLSGAGE